MKAQYSCCRSLSWGFTLIELMISMVLGLIVVGGVVSVLLSNKRSYRTNEALSQIQESARTAFEMIARDVRQSGASGCYNNDRIANVINTAPARWWRDWMGVEGYDHDEVDPAVAFGAGLGSRVAGTDSLHLQGLQGTAFSVQTHAAPLASIVVDLTANPNFAAGDILMICDFDHAAIFEATAYVALTKTVFHSNLGGSPGNCSIGLGFPTTCSWPTDSHTFGPNSQISRVSAVDWYIGDNTRPDEGGRSLYRQRLVNGTTVATEEIVSGVTDMQILYRVEGSDTFVEADAVTVAQWPDVNALSVRLTFDSADQNVSTDVGVNSGRLQKDVTNIFTLRNRVP